MYLQHNLVLRLVVCGHFGLQTTTAHEYRLSALVKMLKAYKASVSFIEEHKAALGPAHRSVVNSIRTEILHLTKLFRSEELPTCGGRESITELIKHIRADVSCTFSSEVKHSLIEAAIARLSGEHDRGQVYRDGTSVSLIACDDIVDSVAYRKLADDSFRIILPWKARFI